MLELPKIRIEVENMKYQIIHAFTSHNEEIEKYVEQELTKVIANYPFSEEVSKVANEILTKAIKASMEEYLLYGEGRKAVKEVVETLMSGLTQRAADGATPWECPECQWINNGKSVECVACGLPRN